MLKIKISDEYEVIEDLSNGVFKATRHGDEWRNLVGDNLILSMLYMIEELQNENKKLKDYIDETSVESIEKALEPYYEELEKLYAESENK